MQVLSAYSMQDYAQEVSSLLQEMATLPGQDVAMRVDCASRRFLGKPYLLGALGEGPEGRFDQSPLYRTDAFDCVTFVNMVLALAMSLTLPDFEKSIIRVNYHQAHLDYLNRYHFTSLDWNVENAKLGLLEDVTKLLKNRHGKKVAQTAVTVIDRPGWFSKRTMTDVKLLAPIPLTDAQALLVEMRHAGTKLRSGKNKLPYLPLDKLFDEEGKADHTLFAAIPHGSVIEIVRPNWDLREQIGTHLNVSHLGFAIWRGKQLMFRQASTLQGVVEDVPLKRYLYRECLLKSKTVKGINIQRVHWPQ